MTLVSIQTVASDDLLTFAALPVPTMIFDMKMLAEADHEVAREVVAASVPNVRQPSRHEVAAFVPSPRSARLHIALEGAL